MNVSILAADVRAKDLERDQIAEALAAPAVQGEPVAWQCVWPCGGVYTTDSYESAKNYLEGAISSHGEDQAPSIRPLYATPQPAEQATASNPIKVIYIDGVGASRRSPPEQ